MNAGWISKLSEFYQALEKPGALGPKLLYEDKSLQHAGLFFEWVQESGVWTNEHYYKGLHADLPAANIARKVPAVTGACLMIDAGLYEAAGGLSGVYVQGDFEDSDLCLRLSQSGRENWYFPGVELYHLEGQSYTSAARQVNYEYNRWLFNEIWANTIPRANGIDDNAMETISRSGDLHERVSSIPGRKRGIEVHRSERPPLLDAKSASRNAIGGRDPRPTKPTIKVVVDKFGVQ